jgi:hypothetical protein
MPAIEPTPPQDIESQRGVADLYNQKSFSRLHDQYRVLSFVASLFDIGTRDGESAVEDTLMWAHYADQFQGLCLAIDSSLIENGLQSGGYRVDCSGDRRSLSPSFYDSYLNLERLCPDANGLVTEPEAGLLVPPTALAVQERRRFVDLMTHKSPAWSYENEVRMIYELETLRASANYRQIMQPCPECRQRGISTEECTTPCYRDAITLPPAAVLAVVVGVDCLISTVDRVIAVLDGSGFSHTKLFWSSLHSSRYAVQYTESERPFTYAKSIQQMRSQQVATAKGHFGPENSVRVAPKGVNYQISEAR